MKTFEIINIMTNAASTLTNLNRVVRKVGADELEEISGESTFMLLAEPCDVIRGLIDALPESLESAEFTKVRDELYPHMYKETKFKEIENLGHEFHSLSHALWNEMQDAKNKFNLS